MGVKWLKRFRTLWGRFVNWTGSDVPVKLCQREYKAEDRKSQRERESE